MILDNYKEAVGFISRTDKIGTEESFQLAKLCSVLLRDSEKEYEARDIIIRIQDAWNKLNSDSHNIWNDLTEASGLYPYVESEKLSKSALLRYEFHKSPFLENVYLHEEQLKLSVDLLSEKSVVVSAPTSFGKSLLIEEIVASKKHKNIVIIQPTLALLDETRKKLYKYRSHYKIVVSTNQEPQDSANIFLFTGERVVEYLYFPEINFFVIDEFYKLSLDRDDDRAISLNQAFHKLLKFTNKFYLLGPMIRSIPESFKEKINPVWFPTRFSTVAVDEKSFELESGIKAKEKKDHQRKKLFDLLLKTKEPTLIYCSSPDKATKLSIEFLRFLNEQKSDIKSQNVEENKEMIEWIEENVNPRWSLIDALKNSIAFHHGAIPRHLGSSIVDAFNSEVIKFLFCTATLIEGVNTSAKNVILFDKKKGAKPIDFFDYKNIAGRSGRMNKHFIGNVFRFEQQPQQLELDIDIPIFTQENAPLEILITLDQNELKPNVQARLAEFNKHPQDLRELLRRNSSVSIDGQLKIITQIEGNLSYYNNLLNWNSYPTYYQLLCVLELGWNNLLKPGENKAGIRNAKHLSSVTMKYLLNKSVSSVIADYVAQEYWINEIPNEQERINAMSFFVLNATRHWFDYKLPKWLSVISGLQEYIFKKNNLSFGDYTFTASSLEHGFIIPNHAALLEYDIPLSAVKKLEKILHPNWTPEQSIRMINQLSDDDLKKRGVIKYEIKKIRQSL